MRPADCVALAPSSQCASSPGKSQPLERAAGNNTHTPTAEERSEVWSDENPAQPETPSATNAKKRKSQTALREHKKGMMGQKDTDIVLLEYANRERIGNMVQAVPREKCCPDVVAEWLSVNL